MNTKQIKRIRDFISALPEGSCDSGTGVLKCAEADRTGGDDTGNCQNSFSCQGINGGDCSNQRVCQSDNYGTCTNMGKCTGILKPIMPQCIVANPGCITDFSETCGQD